jgi:hypothetical protein
MAFPGSIYAPPGVYTRTRFEDPTRALLEGLALPIFLGTGSEILTQAELELVRGSSSSVDQRVVEEDMDGRSVVSVSLAGAVTLGNFDGARTSVQVRNYPIVTGDGTGTTATRSTAVTVTINGDPIVVLSIDAEKGILELASPPQFGDTVRVTYFYNRTDTLQTDTVSEQVSEDAALILGAVGESYEIGAGVNDVLLLTVDLDGSEITITLPENSPGLPWSASQIAAFINSGAVGTSLFAATAVNNHGDIVVTLTADNDITIGAGSANSTLGFSNGNSTARNRVFYTFNGPIVDGSNGGVTTTDPGDVTVRVDGVPVIPASVDGNARAVTLPYAPEQGAVVAITYWHNTWQDTFDYLAHRNVTDIFLAGVTPDRNDFVEGVDFVLQNDLILWGTAAITTSGEHTAGTAYFQGSDAEGGGQITTTLVDARQYLAECAPVTNTSVSPPVTSTTEFQLPLVPTTGNGRNSPLGQDLYAQVSNGRIDLPTTRPDLVIAYVGFGVQDAIDRGAVAVVQVESDTATLRLRDPIQVGMQCYATFYYNTIQDQRYTLAVDTAGAAGVGTYTIDDQNGNPIYNVTFAGKGASLSGINIQFPSGSEQLPDGRHEGPFDTTFFDAAVEEDVTVTFRNKDSTLAKFTVEGSGPYFPIASASDHIKIDINGATLSVDGESGSSGGAAGIDLSAVNGIADLGFAASLVGDEVQYDADSGFTTYDIDATNNEINITLDGVLVSATVTPATSDVDDYVTALNTAAALAPAEYTGAGRFTSSLVVAAGLHDSISFQYTGDVTGLGAVISATIPATTYSSASALATAVDSAISAAIAAAAESYTVAVSADSAGRLVFALTNDAADASGYLEFIDQSAVAATGTVTPTGAAAVGVSITVAGVTLTPAGGARTPGSDDYDDTLAGAAALATEITAAINDGANSFAALVTATDLTGSVLITAVTPGVAGNLLTFTETSAGVAYTLSPLTGTLAGGSDAGANDFSVLAGVDTDAAAAGSQTKLIDGPIARRFTIAGDATSSLVYDRVVIRNRLVPGSGSVQPYHQIAQAQLLVEGSTAADNMGLTVGRQGLAGISGTVLPASLLGVVGFLGGQGATGQPLVTFFEDGGTTPRNNVFKVTIDNVPVTVVFTDAAGAAIATGGSADVPLGPVGTANTVLAQIAAAFTAAGLTATVAQEGAGIRLVSGLDTTVGTIAIGTGNANSILGFVDGATSTRLAVEPEVLASALMAHSASLISDVLNSWDAPTLGFFAAEALAKTVRDDANAEYLYIQSQGAGGVGLGVGNSVTWDTPTTHSVLLPGVGLGVSSGDGATGEAGISGFFVTSSDTVNGSGTANTSGLNDGGGGSGIGTEGDGQDGVVGQTYRDLVTGLTFTVLPREGGINYPGAALTDSFTLSVRRLITTDSNRPVLAVNGIELLVTNTLGVGVGDTALVETFKRSGNEPAIGDIYYVSYNYRKQDFQTRLFTKFSSIEAEYGTLSPDNPVTLAGYLALLNGAVLVGIKQVEKDLGGTSASVISFTDALADVEGVLPGGILPNILTPLDVPSADVPDYLDLMTRHADIQSSIRYRAERTVMAGMPAGTLPQQVQDVATGINRTRLRIFYPDIALLTLPRADGLDEETLVAGPFIAAAMTGRVVSPNVDVATPWTNRRLVGFNRLARVLDAVEQNQVAVRGVTVVEDRPPFLRVRQGLTTQAQDRLLRLPTIQLIVDETQRQARATLEEFIGIKFLPGVLSQIEGRLANTLKLLVDAQILNAYTGVKAEVSPDDPTVIEAEAFIQPVFPVLYIVITFNLRSNL